jgi:hypothetical protein
MGSNSPQIPILPIWWVGHQQSDKEDFHDFPLLLLSFSISVLFVLPPHLKPPKTQTQTDGRMRGEAYDGPMGDAISNKHHLAKRKTEEGLLLALMVS